MEKYRNMKTNLRIATVYKNQKEAIMTQNHKVLKLTTNQSLDIPSRTVDKRKGNNMLEYANLELQKINARTHYNMQRDRIDKQIAIEKDRKKRDRERKKKRKETEEARKKAVRPQAVQPTSNDAYRNDWIRDSYKIQEDSYQQMSFIEIARKLEKVMTEIEHNS